MAAERTAAQPPARGAADGSTPVTRQSEVTASKRPVRYSPTEMEFTHSRMANIAERRQPSVLCDRNPLDSSNVHDV
jgi:hypothetical protein